MTVAEDVHLGVCIGVILAMKYFVINPPHTWTPYFFVVVLLVPLASCGRPAGKYVVIFCSSFYSYYALIQADHIWLYLTHQLRRLHEAAPRRVHGFLPDAENVIPMQAFKGFNFNLMDNFMSKAKGSSQQDPQDAHPNVVQAREIQQKANNAIRESMQPPNWKE